MERPGSKQVFSDNYISLIPQGIATKDNKGSNIEIEVRARDSSRSCARINGCEYPVIS